MAKIFFIPVSPTGRRENPKRKLDPRYLEGQRLLVEALKYLTKSDPRNNRSAITLLSELVRTQFRMSDEPPRLH
ncbi:MAG TPA: hypothetical protein VLT85_13120 [Terriglobales bacterium]|nr:hypothetical protein [Terriglobales bacterium]